MEAAYRAWGRSGRVPRPRPKLYGEDISVERRSPPLCLSRAWTFCSLPTKILQLHVGSARIMTRVRLRSVL